MAGGLLVVAEMLGMIGSAARLMTEDLREAAEAKKDYDAAISGSSMSRATGGGASTMGSSSGAPDGNAGMSKAVTAAGLKAALAVTRRRAQ